MPYGGVCLTRGMPYEGFDCTPSIEDTASSKKKNPHTRTGHESMHK